jgi:hypothetical protein
VIWRGMSWILTYVMNSRIMGNGIILSLRYVTDIVLLLSSISDIDHEACEGEPLWRKKYENAWPIATYMCRYLYNRAACSGNLTRSEDYKPPTQSQPSCARRPLRCGRRYKPYVRENTSPASTRSRTQSYRHDFKPAEQLVDPVQVVEKVVSPHVLSPTIFSHHAARVPFAPTSSHHAHDKGSPELLKSVTQRNKENAASQLPSQATTSSLDPSAPVKEFLCHLGEDLRALLPVFVTKGIKDSATLSEFRKMKDEARAKFLASWKELDDFQHFRLVALNKQD